MKKFLSFIVALLLIKTSFSQEVNIKGKWKVNCALEKKDSVTFHVCDFCPTTILANKTALVEEFEITIDENNIQFTTEEMKFEIPYLWENKTHTLRFKYTQKEYVFKAMVVSDPLVQILVAESGEVLYLKKLL